MPDTIKAEFTRDTLPHEGGPHKSGEVVDLSQESFLRWDRRQAVKVYEAPAVEPAREPAPKPARRTTKKKAAKATTGAKKK